MEARLALASFAVESYQKALKNFTVMEEMLHRSMGALHSTLSDVVLNPGQITNRELVDREDVLYILTAFSWTRAPDVEESGGQRPVCDWVANHSR